MLQCIRDIARSLKSSEVLKRTLSMRVRYHGDVMKWKKFPHYWPFVWGISRSLVSFPHKGQWCGTLIFFNLCLNKRLSKQPNHRWLETPSRSVWRHCNVLLHCTVSCHFISIELPLFVHMIRSSYSFVFRLQKRLLFHDNTIHSYMTGIPIIFQ